MRVRLVHVKGPASVAHRLSFGHEPPDLKTAYMLKGAAGGAQWGAGFEQIEKVRSALRGLAV